jgi:carbon-monoxide dehydrogenase medium subunit
MKKSAAKATARRTKRVLPDQAARDCDALDDPAFPSWYRQRLAVALLAKAIKGAYAGALAKVKR